MAAPLDLFYSYSRKDKRFLDELQGHLSWLQKMGLIRAWSDREIVPGSKWAGIIDDRIKTADIILFLVSSYFLSSDYCMNTEMNFALDRHAKKQPIRIIPVIIRNCAWKKTPLSAFGVLPTDAKPVEEWRLPHKAYLAIYEGVERAALDLGGKVRRRGSRGTADASLALAVS
jgi:hypothetical protein